LILVVASRQRGGILHFYRTIASRATNDRFAGRQMPDVDSRLRKKLSKKLGFLTVRIVQKASTRARARGEHRRET